MPRGGILAVLNQMLRDEFGSVPMQDMLTEKRAALMSAVNERLQPQGKQFGINVVDVRFKRLDLPQENSASIYDRMRTQRAQEGDRRAQGQREARRAAQGRQGGGRSCWPRPGGSAEFCAAQGDAEATKIYNEAFGQDPSFFDFYRSLKAMQVGLGGNNTTFVGEPKGDFFRFFEQNQADVPAQPQQ